jgi:hypothetical protein
LYGAHRKISIWDGVPPNLNASVRYAYLGSLPDVRIPMGNGTSNPQLADNQVSVYPNPFANYIFVIAPADGQAAIYDLSGKQVLTAPVKAGANRIVTTALPRGIYVLKSGTSTLKIVK